MKSPYDMQKFPSPGPGAPFGVQAPVMVPYFVPGVGYVLGQATGGAQVPQANPFGTSQWSIPQLSAAVEEDERAKAAPSAGPRKQPNKRSWPTTKEEYLDRFYEEVFPKLGNKGLVKLQKVAFADQNIRGWHTRKVILPRKKMWNAILEDYVARKIEEFIADSIVPDLALEVLQENKQKKSYDLYGPKFRGEIMYVEEMVGRVVGRLAREAVQETITGFAGDYLRKRNETKVEIKDPVELVSRDLLDRLVRQEAKEVVSDALAEATDLGIVESQFITFYRRKLLKERIQKVMMAAIDDMICEHFVDQALAKILEGLCEPLALLCAEEEFFDREAEEIEKGFDDLVSRHIMEAILDAVADRLEDKNLEFIADQATRFNKYKDFTEEFLNDIIMFDDQ